MIVFIVIIISWVSVKPKLLRFKNSFRMCRLDLLESKDPSKNPPFAPANSLFREPALAEIDGVASLFKKVCVTDLVETPPDLCLALDFADPNHHV
jgi:hypothetical protein